MRLLRRNKQPSEFNPDNMTISWIKDKDSHAYHLHFEWNDDMIVRKGHTFTLDSLLILYTNIKEGVIFPSAYKEVSDDTE